jgi:hypothetical protein
MNAKRNGNIRGGPDRPTSAPQHFQQYDVVALTSAALRMGRLATMGPRVMYGMGWPNEFLVVRTFENESDGPCITLLPCCNNLLVDHRNPDAKRCRDGHPAIYFTKIDVLRPPQKGDKSSRVVLPWLGEILSFDYKEGEENPEFTARFLGKGGSVMGAWAKLLKRIAEANNLI